MGDLQRSNLPLSSAGDTAVDAEDGREGAARRDWTLQLYGLERHVTICRHSTAQSPATIHDPRSAIRDPRSMSGGWWEWWIAVVPSAPVTQRQHHSVRTGSVSAAVAVRSVTGHGVMLTSPAAWTR